MPPLRPGLQLPPQAPVPSPGACALPAWRRRGPGATRERRGESTLRVARLRGPGGGGIGAREAESGDHGMGRRRDGALGSGVVADLLAGASRANQSRDAGLNLGG